MIEQGTKIGRFVIRSELGRGGMGAVYAAHDPQLDRLVALKVMRNATDDNDDRVRMLREGQAMARVTHPNVITVYEVGSEGGIVFLAQELLDGGTLAQWLETRHSRPEILEKFIAAGRGLAAAHAAGLVHRDFKPENVLLGKDGRIRVADFGLARAVGSLPEAVAATARGGGPPRVDSDVTRSPMSPLTRTGTVMGTPMFMAPEQHLGHRADARSDQFAFCVALYHALYRDWPFAGKTAPALADAVIEGRLEPEPKGADVPAALRKIILRGLSTNPADRYPVMEGLLADLEPRPARRSRVPLVVGGLVLAAAAAAGGYAVYRSQTKQDAPPIVAPTPPPIDVEGLTGDKDIAWLTTAIDQGQLDDAIVKYDMAAGIKLQRSETAQASVARSAGAYMRILRGELKEAEANLAEATQHAGDDPMANAFAELAAGALAAARGDLDIARDRSRRCATRFENLAPLMAAVCYQLHGEASADMGEFGSARTAYGNGLAIAQQHASDERTSTLQLALAQLDLDEQHGDQAAASATAIQAECAERSALGCEVHARILLARIRLREAATQRALELLTAVKPAKLESFRTRIAHAIALGELHGYMGEAGEDEVTGLTRIERARDEAQTRGFIGLVLEAKLARVRVLLAEDHDAATAEYAALVKQARKQGFERIARLAEAHQAELSSPPEVPAAGSAAAASGDEPQGSAAAQAHGSAAGSAAPQSSPPRGMLPADGGLPAMRP